MTDLTRAILAFEREHPTWLYQGARETAIRERFDMSPTRYHQILVRLLRDPEAEAHDPATVHRLRRKLDQMMRRICARNPLRTLI